MRHGVGVIILNKKNEVFVGKRKDNPIDKWQMPQGGIDDGEDYISAMKRELLEETSIKSIEILKEIDGFFEYQLPNNLVGIIWKGKYKGQRQKWFLYKFKGTNKDINIHTEYPEFSDYKWVTKDFLVPNIVPFKKIIYEKLLIEFGSYL